MIESNIKNLSVEKIMQKIKEEVAKRKNSLTQGERQPKPAVSQSTEQVMMNLCHEHINVVDIGVEIFQQKEVYEYADFTKYHDVEFIRNCYRGLLKREADTAGLNHYLFKLRSGQLSKSEIVSILRYSKEGKVKNVKLLGSKKRYIITMLNRIPAVGYFFKLFTTLLTLPRLTKRLNEYENYTYQLYMKNIDNEVKLQNAVNNTFQGSFVNLNAFVNTKADKTELQTLSNELQTEIDTKADKTELQTLSNEFQTEIDTKADKTELQTLSNELQTEIDTKADKINLNLKETFTEKPNSFLDFAIQRYGKSIEEEKKLNEDDLYYLLFENVFYDHFAVKEKQKIYLPYIEENKSMLPWLDIGCGRGEFLDILNTRNIKSEGIEINTIEFNMLKEKGYIVSNEDAVSFLKNTSKTFRGISALQVVEHLEYGYLKEMLKLAYSKIEQNGIIILETINPRNELGLANFYMDETHKRPLPAEMMVFLLEWIGFKNIKIVYSALLPENFRNTQINLNYHDYAVIGYK